MFLDPTRSLCELRWGLAVAGFFSNRWQKPFYSPCSAGLLSLPVAYLGIRALILLGPPDIPRLQEAGLNLGILGFASTIVILCAVVLGLVSAIKNWHTDPAEEMKSKSAMISDSSSLTSLRSILIVAEVALSVVLLTGAGLLVHSLLIVRRSIRDSIPSMC